MEENKLIADFIGWTLDNEGLNSYRKYDGSTFEYLLLSNFKFHSDWSWIMEVVDKIESVNDGAYDVNILKNGTQVVCYAEMTTIVDNVANVSFENKIEHVYKAVVEFINYYNEIK